MKQNTKVFVGSSVKANIHRTNRQSECKIQKTFEAGGLNMSRKQCSRPSLAMVNKQVNINDCSVGSVKSFFCITAHQYFTIVGLFVRTGSFNVLSILHCWRAPTSKTF